MATKNQITWAELRVGLFVLLTLTLLGAFTFYITGGGQLFTAQSTYVTYLPSVSGLKAGAPVRLMGLSVGSVDSISLREFKDDSGKRTEVRFRVSSEYQTYIRESSVAFITTEGLLGESVLEIETESLTGKPISSDGEVRGERRGDIKQIVQNVDRITGDIQGLIADMRAGKGTLGALFVDPSIYNRANRIVSQIQAMTQKAAAGEGTLGRLMVKDDIYEKIRNTLEIVDQMAQDIKDGKGTLGGFVANREFYDKTLSVVDRMENVIADVQAGKGTFGKLLTEDDLHNDIKGTFSNVSQITRKINDGEGTLGRSLNDTRLYENINNFTSELRGLISDFRKNPKKYLRIKVSLF